ncbi:hypothetical protein HMPREF9609_01462 [Cutibacterium acnes HL027PA1]|nr:hypothetical protein HMPREF9609_01462 [Cutibacterium acnes HL027PA1]
MIPAYGRCQCSEDERRAGLFALSRHPCRDGYSFPEYRLSCRIW